MEYILELEQEQGKEQEQELEKTDSYPEVDPHVKSLIKSVASEIQKSFSQKNLNIRDFEDEDKDESAEDGNSKNPVEKTEEAAIAVPIEVPIVQIEEPSFKAPVDFDAVPVVLDSSMNREKMNIVRKSSRERRLPAGIIAKKKAAEKLKDLIKSKSAADKNDAITNTLKDLIDPDNKSDEEKAELLAKEMSKLENSQVLQILQSVEQGILDFSIPMLIPFLSLQVKLTMSKNIYNELDSSNKTELMKESIIDSLVNDITDIAILQEVIDRSQAKLNTLKDEEHCKECATQSEIHMKDAATLTDSTHLESASSKVQSKAEGKDMVSSFIKELEKNEFKNETANVENRYEDKEKDIEKSTSTSSTDHEESNSRDELESSLDKTEQNDKSEDSGIETEEGSTENMLSKSKSEKNIKQKILNILNDAKALENTRNVRTNFGRNFEFQKPQLTPVIPNDRRPLKAKKMDSMWCNQIAPKNQSFNGLTTPKPTARVPWTMKANPTPVKKESILYNNEVEEFEKCRSALKENKGVVKTPVPVIVSKVSLPNAAKKYSKNEISKNLPPQSKAEATDVKKEAEAADAKKEAEAADVKKEVTKKEVVIEVVNSTTEQCTTENISVKESSVTREEVTEQKVSPEQANNPKTITEQSKKDDISVKLESKEEVMEENVSLAEANTHEQTKESVCDAQNKESSKILDSKLDDDETEVKAVEESRESSPDTSSEWEATDSEKEEESPADSFKLPIKPVPSPEPNKIPDPASTKPTEGSLVPTTPIIRRRQEAASVVSVRIPVPHSGPPPPPPSSRPPPPPPTFRPPPPPLSPTAIKEKNQ